MLIQKNKHACESWLDINQELAYPGTDIKLMSLLS